MSASGNENSPGQRHGSGLWLLIACLVVTLSVLFWASFDMGQALFANDGPYGVLMSNLYKLPDGFFGIWNDLFWVGTSSGNFTPNATALLLLGLGRRLFINFYTPCTALILGLCAWIYFRQLRFNAFASVLGGLAAALNMNFFSNACWGLGSRGLCLASIFLALAAVESSFRRFSVPKLMLAGLAIGMSISEGGDNGAIFSLFVAGYTFFRSACQEGSLGWNVAKGMCRVALVAVCAGVLALQSLFLFQETAVKGVVGMKQDMSSEQRWDWATQWSLPKLETLRVIIPGVYGYRLDTPNGGNYWGAVGQQPGWEQHHQGFPRHSGAGEYAGVLVVLVALWSVANAFSKKHSAYSQLERRTILFWSGMALVALVLAWGRYAPFYWFVYHLPYFSAIRNPMKFMHPFHMILMILFAYGLMGLSRLYLESAVTLVGGMGGQVKKWWAQATPFEKSWNYGCGTALALSVLAFLVYGSAQEGMAKHLTTVGFNLEQGKEIANFGLREVGLFIMFLGVCMGLLILVQSRAFSGKQARWAGLLLGFVLLIDLVRADYPWIQYFKISEKYADNPVLTTLREHAREGRVSVPNFRDVPQAVSGFHGMLQQVYHIEWLQHHFQLYNIPGMEVAQMPRVPEDYAAFNGAIGPSMLRMWQLTSTRYLMAVAGFAEAFNQQLDPEKKRFRTLMLFDIGQRPGGGITAETNSNGQLALIEFTGALPRARLYTQWQTSTNDEATLKRLADPSFDPDQMVLVAENVPAPGAAASNAVPGKVEYGKYSPRRFTLQTQSTTPSVLLVNDRYDASWQVRVDGKPAPLLRCNYVMRGVQLPAGDHTVEFAYRPKLTGLVIMAGAEAVGLLLLGFLLVAERIPPRRKEITQAGSSSAPETKLRP